VARAKRLALDEAMLAAGLDPYYSLGGRADVGGGTPQVDMPSGAGDGSFSGRLREQYNDPARQEGRRLAKRGVIDAKDIPDDPVDASHLNHDHDWLGG
jgi:hypothetical protein